MGDKATLKMARQELEDLYLGVPDESVDLTFKDLPSFQQNDVAETKINNNATIILNPIHGLDLEAEDTNKKTSKSLTTSPSLDFAKGLQGVLRDRVPDAAEAEILRERAARNSFSKIRNNGKNMRSVMVVDDSKAYELGEVSTMSTAAGPFEGRRRRPGIPHSNICALCSNYIYLFRHRCLVCGRVYCRQCVRVGMGEMTEGRKCVECLGRRYSHRYIHKAGKTGCWRYPSAVKIQELIWAEKGPARRKPPSAHDAASISRSVMMAPSSPSRSYVARARAPAMPGTTSPRSFVAPSPSPFGMSSTFTPNPHGFPL